MRICVPVAAVALLACSPVSGQDEAESHSLLLVTASGVPESCGYQLEQDPLALPRPDADQLARLQSAGTVLVAAVGDTSFRCVTRAVDQLNDLGISAEFEEKAWQNLRSVAEGGFVQQEGEPDHPQATVYDRERTAQSDVDAALSRAQQSGNRVLLVLGANWCHDSRGLAGWFETPRVARMLARKYEVAYVDVGYRDRNIDIARRFGIDEINGTPTVLVLSPEGELLNPESAPTWRNAASRSEDAIFDYFDSFKPELD